MEFLNIIIVIFEGQFKNDKKDWHGKLIYKNVNVFEIQYKNGKNNCF